MSEHKDLRQMRQQQQCINALIYEHYDWACHDGTGGNGNNTSGGSSSSGSGGSGSSSSDGKDGKSLEFRWNGTKLGVRVEGQGTFQYVDLKGVDGETPHVDPTTKRWFIGTSDTGISAAGLRGADGETPQFQIGTVTTLPAGSSATASVAGTPANPILNLGIPSGLTGDPATNTDEKVKMNASSSNAQYMEDWIDKTTIIYDPAKNAIKAVTLDGLQATVTTLNFIKNLDKDIMSYLGAISNPMTFRASVADDAALNAYPNPESGDTFIVRSSASNGGKTMTFIYNGTNFEPIAETTVSVRDFATNPLNLATESTGTLPESRIDPLLARLSQVLTKADYGGSDGNTVHQADTLKGLTKTIADIEAAVDAVHSHSNKTLLDALLSTGDGSRFLTDKGTYSGLYWVSSTAPANKGLLWVDNSDTKAPIMNYWDGTKWVPVSSAASSSSGPAITVDASMSATSTNPVQNKIVKAYIDALDIPVISTKANNAITEESDGWHVEDPTDHINDLQEEIRILRKSQYHVNTDLDYLGLIIPATGDIGVNQVIPLTKKIGNMEIANNRIKLKAGRIYKFDTHISYSTTSGSGLTNYANIKLMWLDETNNKEIGEVRQYIINDPAFEYNGSSSYLYQPDTDCDVRLYAKEVFITDRVDPRSCATVTEVGRAIEVDDPMIVDSEKGIEDTPIGTVIPMMGTKAPAHYLICNGAVYNIADYPELADHMKDNFGKINYFGGDGITTFAVPDLRGEFLRGSGTAARATGSGAAVGTHQNPTKIPWLQYYVNTANNYSVHVVNYQYKLGNQPEDCDKVYTGNAYYRDLGNGPGTARSQNYGFNPRPTNTSVLWCIKAEATYFMKVEGKDVYSKDKHLVGYWVDGKPLYEKTIEVDPPVLPNTTYEHPHNITNYDTIFVSGGVLIEPTKHIGTTVPFSDGSSAQDLGVWTFGDLIAVRTALDRTGYKLYVSVRWTEK